MRKKIVCYLIVIMMGLTATAHAKDLLEHIVDDCNFSAFKLDETTGDLLIEVNSNQIYIRAKAKKENEQHISLYFLNTYDLGSGGVKIPWDYVNRNKKIADIVRTKDKVSFFWYGFYNDKKHDYFWQNNADWLIVDGKDEIQTKTCHMVSMGIFSAIEDLAKLADTKFSYDSEKRKKLSHVERYIKYMSMDPINTKNEGDYLKIAAKLVEATLYNEAIMVAANVANFNPKAISAYLIIGRSYGDAGNPEKAKEYYRLFIKTARENNIQIPQKILNMIENK